MTPRGSGLRLRQLETYGSQHGTEADQRQSDQSRRVSAVDGLAERDAEPFAFESSGAVEWRFHRHVTHNRVIVEGAKAHPGDIDELKQCPVGMAPQRHSRHE